jgi:PDZ domain (Also known as DHR or GLGF).
VLLCYGGDESDVSVYVGDVEENSDADVSGKIMVGDQIVQVGRYTFSFAISELKTPVAEGKYVLK